MSIYSLEEETILRELDYLKQKSFLFLKEESRGKSFMMSHPCEVPVDEGVYVEPGDERGKDPLKAKRINVEHISMQEIRRHFKFYSAQIRR